MRGLPNRIWKLPRREDDEAADGEGLGRILALSDGVFARFWVIHRLAFRLIARDDNALVWLNLLLLLFVSFLPFPTAVLGRHPGSPAAAAFYAIAVILASVASAAYWWYASGRGGLLRPDVGRTQVRALRARGLSGPVLFILSLPVAVFAPYAAEAVWIFIFPLTRIVFAWFSAEEREQAGQST